VACAVATSTLTRLVPAHFLGPPLTTSSGSGEQLPDLPEFPSVESEDFVGVYRGATVDVAIEADEGRLILIAGEERIPLEPMSSSDFPDAFVADHPAFSRFLLCFGRDATGSVVELTHGGDWYATDTYEGA
jgi:hypothetical protein